MAASVAPSTFSIFNSPGVTVAAGVGVVAAAFVTFTASFSVNFFFLATFFFIFTVTVNFVEPSLTPVALTAAFFFVTGPLWFVIGLESAKATDAFGDKGAIIESYKDYDEAASSRDVRKILPPGAKDITIVRKLYFQGHSIDFRCGLSEEDFEKFVAKHKYVFKEYNLAEGGIGWSFRWHKEGDALFSQFPDVENGQVVGHHPDGYLTCVANDRLDGGNPDEESLLYIYDKKCSVLWAQCWR